MRRTSSLLLALLVVASACSGDDSEPVADDAPTLVAAMRDSGRAEPEAWVERDGIVGFVAPEFTASSEDPVEAAYEYFTTFADAYGVASPRDRLAVVTVAESAAGTIVRFRQELDGLLVFAGDLTVAVNDDGTILRVTGVLIPDRAVADAELDADDATAAALHLVPGTVTGSPQPVVAASAVDGVTGDPVPAWEITVAIVEDGVPIEHLVLIDALDGSVLFLEALDLSGQDWDVFDAKNALDDEGESTLDEAELLYRTRAGSTESFGDGDSTTEATRDNMRATWDYFFETFGRDGHDDAGGICNLYVHVGNDWSNATGNSNCTLRFGDGGAYATARDVVTHEFTHAVTGQTAGLKYQGESGALNEHYSDFFAGMVDTEDWQVSPSGRNMSTPDIDSVDEFLVTESDYGGVHSNSGIPNMVGFLVANDGSATHPDSGVAVQGIGRAKAAQVWYATLLSLSPRSGFGIWACATVTTAADMVDGLLTEEEADSVLDAMVAAGLLEEDGTLESGFSCDWLALGSSTIGGSFGPSGTTPTTTVPGATTTSSLPDGSGEACPPTGTWLLRSQEYVEQLAALSGAPGTMEYVEGAYRVEIREDGSYLGIRDEWTLRVSSDQGNLVFAIDSEDPGSWEADETTLSIVDFGSSETEVTVWVEINGQLTPVPFGSQTVASEPISGSGDYTCVNGVLTVTVSTEYGPLTATFDLIG